MKLHFTAAEASGDLLARETIDAVRNLDPAVDIVGIGGAEMAAVGIDSPFDISPLSVLGYTEALKAYGAVRRLADEAVDHIIAAGPDAAVLVDSWGFTIRVAERLRARAPQIRIVKMVGPQIWATRPGRAAKVAAAYDQVLCVHEMELPYYEGLDIDVDLIGNPALSRTEQGDADGFRARHGLDPECPILLILPGSRPSEISRVAPVLMDAASQVSKAMPEVQRVILPADTVAAPFHQRFPSAGETGLVAPSVERFDAMAAADLALACSGTVTSELAVQGAPMIVGYKTGWITWALARYVLYKPKHITLLNIASDDTEIVPEFVQTRFRADLISETAVGLLSDPLRRKTQLEAQQSALEAIGLGGPSTPERAARAIVEKL